MEHTKNHLIELGENLDADIAAVLNVARAIAQAGGDSPEWREILTKFEIGAMPAKEKSQEVSRLKANRGASIEEVLLVCEKLIVIARRELVKIESQTRLMDVPESEALEIEQEEIQSQCERFEDRIDSLLDQRMAEYKNSVIPKKSMFGGIKKRALEKKKEVTAAKQRSGFTLKCKNCGAPRMSEAEFECGFCGSRFGN